MEKPCSVCLVIKPLDQFARKPTGLYGTQARCRPCQAIYRKAYYHKDPERARAKSREYFAANAADMSRKGIARVRARKAADPEYRDFVNAQSRALVRALRLEVLTHYSGGTPSCACCGVAYLEFLHVDHINGDGAAHRRQIGSKGGYGVMYWLRRNGYPDGFRVLCANCNIARGRYGYCPHERE